LKSLISLILVSLFLLWACNPPTPGVPSSNTPPDVPSNPVPQDNATNVPVSTVLSWTCNDPDGDNLTYDIYFGTSNNNLPRVESDYTSNSYDSGTLQFNTTYYWKIVAKDGKTSTAGPVWKFTTQAEVASEPQIVWAKCFGGSDEDRAFSIQETDDGGFIFVGQTKSNDGDVSGLHWGGDVWAVKIDSTGNVEWQRCLGGSYDDVGYSVKQTTDGGYIIAGGTTSNDGDVTEYHGGYGDVWVVKLNTDGNIEWSKCLGGSQGEVGMSVDVTDDGGYIIAGETYSDDEDVSGNHGDADIWVVKLDNNGSVEWQKCLGGSFEEHVYSIQQTSDGGYIVVGETWSNDGDVSGNHGTADMWVVKLSSDGDIEWQKCLGGIGWDTAYSVIQTNDGGYVVVGDTSSDDGDVSGNHGGYDVWVVKLNSQGEIAWQRCFGGENGDAGYSVKQTDDGGFIIVGETRIEEDSSTDVFVLKLDENGNLLWQKTLGGSDNDYGESVDTTSDGGYIVAGYTQSNDEDVSGNHGVWDVWIVKLK